MRHYTLHSDMTVVPSAARRALAYCLVCLLAWQPLLANAGGITPTQASNGRPTLDQAANGVPVINIQNPNAKGVSQNFYHDFNVNQHGVVLNNNRTLHQTKLGGYIEGNPNLKNGSASLIINEVTGTSASALNGYMEVGGARADVIVANPNGISCSGCGFINTNHATLTTGKPLLDAGGSLRGFDVERGRVTIGGNGLNASNVDRFDIIARGIKLSAELHANELNVVTGKQQVSSDTLAISHESTDDAAPKFAIDSSKLGGIYANRIRLIANEQGVGVKLDAPVAAQNGDLVLRSDGKIRFANASAGHDMQVGSNDDVAITGTAVAANAIHIDAEHFVANGQQVSAKTLNVDAAHTQINEGASLYGITHLDIKGNSLDNAGGIGSGKNIAIGTDIAPVSLTNTGSVFAKGDLNIHAGDLNNANDAELDAGNDIDISATGSIANRGNLLAQNKLTITTGSLTNQRLKDAPEGSGTLGSVEGSTRITAGATRNLGGARLHSGDQLQLDVTSLDNSGELDAAHNVVIGAKTALTSFHNAGAMSATNVKIHADNLANESGASLNANNNILITSDGFTNRGKVLAQQDLVLDTRQLINERLTSASNDSYDGLLGGLDSATITADTIGNLKDARFYSGGQLKLDTVSLDNSGSMDAVADLLIGAQTTLDFLHNVGKISAGHNLNIHANDLTNDSGAALNASNDITITSHSLTNSGNLLAQQNLVLRTGDLANLHLTVAVDGDGVIGSLRDSSTIIADTISNQLGAQIYSGKQLDLNADTLDNAGSVGAGTDIIIGDQGALVSLHNIGNLSAGQSLSVNASDLINDSNALLRANKDISLTANSITNQGYITNQRLVSAPVEGDIDVNKGADNGVITLAADTISNLIDAQLYSTHDMRFAATSLNNDGLLLADGKLTIGDHTALGSVHNTGTVGADRLVLNSDSMINNSGASLSADRMEINLTGDLLNLGQLLGRNGLWVTASNVTNKRQRNSLPTDATLGGSSNVQIVANNLNNLNGALLGAGDSMALIIRNTLGNDHANIQAQNSLYIAAALPPASDKNAVDSAVPNADEAEINALKNMEVINKSGQIVSTNGDIQIFTHHLDNSRHVATEKDHHISAYDLMEANWRALHDDVPDNDHFRLYGNNATLNKDDWAFLFDPGVYNLPFYQCECDVVVLDGYPLDPGGAFWHRRFASFWLSNYINYLQDEYGAGLSSNLIANVTSTLVSSEAKLNHAGGGINPVAQSMWIVARTSQLIKEYEPKTYDKLKAKVTQKIKADYGTLNVWNTRCADWTSDDCDNGKATYFQYNTDRYDDAFTSDTETTQSLISAGGDLYINADTIDNQFSTIASAGNMELNGSDIINNGITLQRHYQIRWAHDRWHNGVNSDWRPADNRYTGWDPTAVDLLGANGKPQVAKSLIVAGGSINGTLEGDLKNKDATYLVEHHMPSFDSGGFDMPEGADNKPDAPEKEVSVPTGEQVGAAPPAYVDWSGSDVPRVIDTINARTQALLDGHSSLFHINTDPDQRYLIETNPLFASKDGFLGSEYLIKRLDVTPDITQRRLGDSYYETTLIRDAVIDATGTRFLDPNFQSDTDQFSWLMNNAVAAAESMQLAVGVSLTADQINALQQDIVWMEEKDVAGVKVLVPVLYLAPGSADLANQGAVISANHGMNLSVNGLANSGVMAAQNNLNITVGDHGVINMEGLMQSGGVLGVNSSGTIQNLSSTMRGRDVSLHSDHNILNSAWVNQTKQHWKNGSYLRTEHGDGSLIEGKDNVILNGANIGVYGSDIKGDTIAMQAKHNITVSSLGVTNAFDGHAGDAEYRNHQTYQLASNIEASLDLLATAGHNINVIGSKMTAGNNLGLKALTGDITVRSAAKSHYEHYHYEDSDKEVTRTNNNITQLRSGLSAGGVMDVNAVLGNLMVTASSLDSGDDMSLHAGQTIQLLAAQNEEYHFAQIDKDGDYGSHSHKKDMTHKITNEVDRLDSGGKLTISSNGDQRYQAAQLHGQDGIHLVSGGHVSFEAVKNLVSETHESNSGDLAWNKAAGNGKVDETALQTEITTQANLAIDAADGISIDVNDIDAKTVSTTIDAMVAKNPKLSWLKDAEARGDVDWRQIKENHDNWDYESQSMGAATALVVAIVATAATAGAGGAIAGAIGMAGNTVAVATAGAVAATATNQAASAVINNQGNLGHAIDDLDHSDTYKSLATSGVTAGLMTGVSIGYSNMDFGKIQGDTVNGLTKGFDLDSFNGKAGFASYKAVEAGVSAGVSSSINGTSFNDTLKHNIEQAGNDTLAALAFNEVGGLSVDQMANSKTHAGFNAWAEGGSAHALSHAIVGGGVSYLTDHNFKEGAVAGAVNEALSPALDRGLDENGKWRTAGAQLAGGFAAIAAGGNANTGAYVAKQADAYNRQLHLKESKIITALRKDKTPEEQQRLDAAACYLTHCGDGVPSDDTHKENLVALQKQGAAYSAEQDQLKATGLFTHGNVDAVNDFLTRHGEAVSRVEGGVGVAAGMQTALAGGTLAIGGCGFSVGTLCWASSAGGAALVGLGYGQAEDSANKLFGGYTSTQGQRVSDSYNLATFPGEQNPALDLAKDAGTNLLLFNAGAGTVKVLKYLDDVAADFNAATRMQPKFVVPNSTKARIEANIAESQAARSSSNFSEYANRESLIHEALATNQSPWPLGVTPTTRPMSVGEQFNMVIDAQQAAGLRGPGGFGTFADILDQNFARQTLAITEEFKSDVSFLQRYEVVRPFDALTGPIGPQIDQVTGRLLPGSRTVDQLDLQLPWNQRTQFLKPVSSPLPLPVKQ